MKRHKDIFIHETAVVDESISLGEGTKVWHFTHIMSNAKIGKKCSLGQNVFVASNVTLGNNVKVQNNVSIYEGVICEDDVFLGPSMVFTNVINPRAHVARKDEYKTTLVRRGVSIGANATIVCGVELGEFSFVGAGSTVTKDVKPFELVYGSPATHKGWVSRFGHKLDLNEIGDEARCPQGAEVYKLTRKGIIIL